MPKKVLFLYLGTENLGIEALSSYLKAEGYTVELLMDPALFSGSVVYNNALLGRLIDSRNEGKLKKAIAKSRPDLIGFSVFTGNYLWALKWAKISKEIYPDVPVVFGGIHPTSVPEEVIGHDFIDAVVVGEGEDALAELLSRSKEGRKPDDIMNTVVKVNGKIVKNPVRPYIRDLDSCPILDKELFYNKIPGLEECYYTITSRGCPFKCTYCANNVFHNDVYNFERNHVRRRSVDNVIRELKVVKARKKAKKIFFGDDLFIFDRRWLEEFSEKYRKEIGMPFWCSAHPAVVSEDIVRLLKQAGCWLVTMGVQSGSPRIRRDIFHRMETDDAIKKASRLIKESGIILSLDNIFGAPTEKEEDLMLGLQLYQDIKPQRIHTFWLTYFPATDILNTAVMQGDLTPKDTEDIKKGKVGLFDFGGSVKRDVRMYLKYEFFYQILPLLGYSEKVKRFLLKYRRYMPASAPINKLLIILNAFKNNDTKFFYIMKTLFYKRNIP